MNFITRSILLMLVIYSGNIVAQSIEITTNPPKANVLFQGISTVKDTPTKAKFEGKGNIYVFKDNYQPVVLRNGEDTKDVNIDLVPVIDLIGAKKTPTISFSKLLITIPLNQEIGSTGLSNAKTINNIYVQRSLESGLEKWKGLIEEELELRNISIARETVDLFGGRTEKAASKFLLAAEVTDAWISIVSRRSYAFLTIRWSLYDQRLRKVVYEGEGYGFGQGPENYREHLDGAFTSAATLLSCDEEFLNVLLGTGENEEGNNVNKTEESIEIEPVGALKIDEGSNLIKRCIESTVTVVTKDGFGSGVVISSDGKILTNSHVVEGSAYVEVVFSNGLRIDAEVIRSDSYFDVALLEIASGKGFKPLPLAVGENKNYDIGDDVMAIGTPISLDLGQTVSRGIVSGNRSHEDRLFIQTDVSVNAGNSGGPLINKEGKVIGLVTLKISDNRAEGLAFAIPISQVAETLNINVVD
jgi:S1-C subfamily serine protease